MGSQSMVVLVNLTVATTVAFLLVCLTRRSLRRAVGAQAAYWLWLMIPASALAVVVPASWRTLAPSARSLPEALVRAIAFVTQSATSVTHDANGALVWAVGAAVMVIVTVRRQQAFVRSLGPLWRLSSDTYRSNAVAEPMLVGAWQPRIVLPADFEARYTEEECALVLAHERAHLARRDALVNAIATSWLCLLWFNPLLHWAIELFRFDQELACDARVLATAGSVRRSYAGALLKIQLSVGPAEPVPIGCHWRSGHPLRERIAMLKSPLPGGLRRVVGVGAALVVIASGTYVVWMTQPAAQVQCHRLASRPRESRLVEVARA